MTPDELRRITKSYWLDAERMERSDAVRQYVRDLLPHELAYARQRDRNTIPSCAQPCDWLALLVGYSWEPLLQAVCVYQPDNILLVLNEHYGDTSGVALGRELADIISALPRELYPGAGEVKIHPDPLEFGGERPGQIFRFLRDCFLDRLREAARPRIVLDITGAKKSMVAGAYLFGAYANVVVSYVDFDEYDPRQSRPYGYTCRIGPLENPYEAFRLRDWQRVGQLYDQYAFRAARALLREIISTASQPMESGSGDVALYSNNEQEGMRRLDQALAIYECWDNGDLVGSQEASVQFLRKVSGFQPPTAVTELHAMWPRADLQAAAMFEAFGRLELGLSAQSQPPDPLQSLYLQERPLLIYAHDELAKIDRLINHKEDYRSALVRAAGLHENLITARMLRLWMEDKLYLYFEGTGTFSFRKDIIDAKQRSKSDKVAAQVRVGAAIPGLLWSKGRPPSKPDKFPVYQAERQPKLQEFWKDWPINWEQFAELRNKAAHFCLQVPRTVAEQARELSTRNLEEFEKNWRQPAGPVPTCVTEALPWDQLCGLCGVTFLPPRIEGGLQ